MQHGVFTGFIAARTQIDSARLAVRRPVLSLEPPGSFFDIVDTYTQVAYIFEAACLGIWRNVLDLQVLSKQ